MNADNIKIDVNSFKRSQEEIDAEIKELLLSKKRVNRINNAGDPNRKIIDAEIHFLRTGESTWKMSWFYSKFSIVNVLDWLKGDDVQPSDLWHAVAWSKVG